LFIRIIIKMLLPWQDNAPPLRHHYPSFRYTDENGTTMEWIALASDKEKNNYHWAKVSARFWIWK
jgi:hypothetical protein